MHEPLSCDIGGTCLLPHAVGAGLPGSDDGPRAAWWLLGALSQGAHHGQVRDAAWAQARKVQARFAAGCLERGEALEGFDAICATWSLADRLGRAWRALERADTSNALQLAGLARERLGELEAMSSANLVVIEQLYTRVHALWQLADGLEEASFLRQNGDVVGARDRASALVRHAVSLQEMDLLTEDEALLVEDLGERWGATTRWLADEGGRWVS